MNNRHELIARKNEVRGRIERVRRELTREQQKAGGETGRRVRKLEGELDRLMAEEYRLRVEIDRARS